MSGAPLPVGDVVIAGVGARTASGLTALQATMAARARKIAPEPSHMIDRHGEPIATARLMSIGDNVIGIDRYLALGAPALTQAAFPWLSLARNQGAHPKLPVVVALPSDQRPGFDARVREHLLPTLESRSHVAIDVAKSEVVTRCRGGGVIAFEKAIALVRSGEHDAVVAGGIDSYFDPDALEWLDRELRLHSPNTENGFIPGEGAAFVLLVPQRKAESGQRLGQILSAASAQEPHPYGSADPCLADGITNALRAAVHPCAREKRVGWVLTDVANERHRVQEWSYAFARQHRAFKEDVIHEQPLLKTGDVGAASAALLVAMACVRWQTGCAVDDIAVVATHSDGADRGAMLIAEDAS